MMDTLVLNADGNPLSYLPLSTINWQEAIRYIVLDKVSVIQWHENWIVRSVNWETFVPSILMLKEYTKPKHYVRFSKSNVFLRDNYTCQYCNKHLQKKDCTLDHVKPVSQGGRTVFENTVTACVLCNATKGSYDRMTPKIKPYKPAYFELVNKRKVLPFNVRQNSWLIYINS
jgi:5-methylcytosine-specific restriction endonuclease McrA